MNYKHPKKNSFKNTLKKFDLIVKFKRIIYKYLSLTFLFKKIFLILQLNKFFDLKVFKKIKFQTNKNKYFIHYTKKDIFILSSKDQQISNSIYLNTADRIKSLKMIENSRRFLDQLNKKNITQLIDVGASIGNVIITAISEKFYETGIAIEPSKEEFKILKANIILNNLENKIKLINCALTNNESEFINFELDEKDIGDQRVFYKEYDGLWGERKRNIISVNNKTFDNLFEKLELSNSLIWLNNQGSEAQVIAGGKKLLNKFKPPLMLEYGPYYLKNSDSHQLLLNNILKIYSNIYDPLNFKSFGKIEEFDFNKVYENLGERGDYTYFLIV